MGEAEGFDEVSLSPRDEQKESVALRVPGTHPVAVVGEGCNCRVDLGLVGIGGSTFIGRHSEWCVSVWKAFRMDWSGDGDDGVGWDDDDMG